MDSFEQAGRGSAGTSSTGSSPVRRAAEFSPVPADRRRWWQVDCRGAQNAHRSLTVLVNRDRVVLVGPPGETAVLSSDAVGELSTALREAAEQARK